MSDATGGAGNDPIDEAYQNGRRFGLATAAFAASVVAWFNLFGVEKSILAIVLSILAMQGAKPFAAAVRRGRIALVIAALNTATIIGLLIAFHDKFGELIRLLHKLELS